MSDLVSILIPAHNAAPWIAETIESALNQTWQRTEIIVVDDGSTDETANRALQYRSNDVRVIRQDRRGAAAARNRALAEASGDFLQFLDADDVLASNKIEQQIVLLGNAAPGFVSACEWGRFHGSIHEARFLPEPVWADLDPVSWLVSSLSGGGMMHPAAWLVPRTVAGNVGPWDERLSLNDDFEYFARVLLASRGVKFSRGARSFYRSGLATSLSRQRSDQAWESACLSLELGVDALLRCEDSDRTRRAAATAFQRFMHDVFAYRADLAERAQTKVDTFGGSDAVASGGPIFDALSRVVGWRHASRVRKLAYQFGYMPLAARWSSRD